MKPISFLVVVSVILSVGASDAVAAVCATKFVQSKGKPEVRDLPVTWNSAEGADIQGAGAYERECKAKGIEPDPVRLNQILGGSPVHLRLTTLPNGLRSVTIHKADGAETFNDTAYHGLISCGCGAIHDGAAVSTPKVAHDVDLGDGFRLTVLIASPGRQTTGTYADKKYVIPGASVELKYNLESRSPMDLYLKHETLFYKERPPGASDAIMPEQTQIVGKSVSVELGFRKGDHEESKITVAYNLASNPWDSDWDQVTFAFDENGALAEVSGKSQTSKFNGDWNSDEVRFALKKGKDAWFEYGPTDPRAAVLFKAVFGRGIDSLEGLSYGAVNAALKAAVHEKPLNLSDVVRFRKSWKQWLGF